MIFAKIITEAQLFIPNEISTEEDAYNCIDLEFSFEPGCEINISASLREKEICNLSFEVTHELVKELRLLVDLMSA